MPGAPRFSWAQSAETSTSERLMGGSSLRGGGGWMCGDADVAMQMSGGARGERPPEEQVQLAAEAEAHGRVEQGRHERERRGDGADHGRAEQVADGADHGEHETD